MSVYFIRCAGFVKIGYTTDVEKRLASMLTDCPLPMELAAVYPGTKAHERALHYHLRKSHFRGEWFSPSPEVEAALRSGPLPDSAPSPHPRTYRHGGGFRGKRLRWSMDIPHPPHIPHFLPEKNPV